ncbi:hypothetical protein W97_03448 [Coniosporium apollinis CBS 100218]|uniref:Uncharacterized protein n=1 Tax=Coniosporium apollinis (strain CBS 100218) TaxID=1168221 RepID=R7YQU1_CONA1|nr:uncharacterized protein W97_03448 [Coniosporium apollinis CBS 100218]EON64218.1 hypothetical protein W97_03448 [Coniosporium apollinis CBS 100218]
MLLAASGPKILSISLHDGSLLSTWPETASTSTEGDQENEEPEGPPGKRRKLDASPEKSPNVTKLLVSHSNEHVVAVTGEDKCVRVFAVSSNGNLEQLSQRCMPKRPCAIALTADDSTILCGDKFGDVYGLPLLSSPEADAAAARQQEEAASKSFVPSATNLTVHSGRNRKALENQLKSANQQAKTKEPLKFAHELLLGHVSMLTDVAFVAFDEATSLDRKPRSYILTSDRDEHIRISRAPPQAHIIEGYCLGHKEFVSKLCLPRPGILVSGGGDDEVFVWYWQGQDPRLTDKINLRKAVFKALLKQPAQGATKVAEEDVTIAVSGMWTFESAARNEVRQTDVLVACEGVPALFYFSTLNTGALQRGADLKVLPLSGNPVDVAVLEDSIVVSIDNCHESGSISVARQDQTATSRLQAFVYAPNSEHDLGFSWRSNEKLDGHLQKANSQPTAESAPDPKALVDLLYGIESLRKRGGEEVEGS